MTRKELEKFDKETLIKMVELLETMNDLQAQYEPLNTEDGYVEEEDAEAYDEAYDKLRELKGEM